MRILVITPDFVAYGGTSRFLERLLCIHARRAIDTTLLVPTGQCCPELVHLAKQYNAELILSPNRTDVDTKPFLTPWYDYLFSWRTVLKCRPDLIIVSTGDPGRMSISLYFPVPVLYVLHSVPELAFRLLPRLYMKLGSLLNNRVMTVSLAAAQSLYECMGIPRARITVVHNSCGIQKLRTVPGTPVVLTAGHLVDYKNPALWLDIACAVVQRYPEIRFVWLGDGILLKSLREKIKALNLEEKILVPGYVADPSTWFAQAQIYFQPSIRESHGIAVLEAMVNGLPCVVSDIGGLPESVHHGETGFVCPPDDLTAFSSRIEELLGDSVLRERMGTAGRNRVATCFSEEIQEQKILALYECLAKKGAM